MLVRCAVAVVASVATLGVTGAVLPDEASAHRSRCHQSHACPSDHATYRWRGMLCVSPASGESRRGFPRRVRYDGRTYYCKR